MRYLVQMILLVGLTIAMPSVAEVAESTAPTEIVHKLRTHTDSVRKLLDAHYSQLKDHKDQFDKLAAEVAASSGDDPNAMLQMQFQMQQVQQQWEVTSTALQTLNEMYQTMARATQGQ